MYNVFEINAGRRDFCRQENFSRILLTRSEMKEFSLLCILYFLCNSASYAEDDDQDYCRISPKHTMCSFPFDDHGKDCINIEDGDLDTSEIVTILHQHNLIRNAIAQGNELRGNPGPQPAARNMLEMAWDKELALIARRWALQCQLFHSDTSRDVARFGVWQNVDVLILESLEKNTTSFMRIMAHMQAWHDEVKYFDAAEVGLVKYDGNMDYPAYIGLASANINLIGCARCVYTAAFHAEHSRDNSTIDPGERVDVLICNYGPLDRTIPGPLYEIGVPGFCPNGTVPSREYGSLCAMQKKRDSRSKSKPQKHEDIPEDKSVANLIVSRLYISELFILIYLFV